MSKSCEKQPASTNLPDDALIQDTFQGMASLTATVTHSLGRPGWFDNFSTGHLTVAIKKEM